MNEEPFDFLRLPLDLQLLICEQFNFNTYNNLMKTSKQVRKTLYSKKRFYVMDIPYVSLHKRRLRVTLPYCEDFENKVITWEQMESSQVTIHAEELKICAPLTYTMLNKLEKLVHGRRLIVNTIDQTVLQHDMEKLLDLIQICKPFCFETCQQLPDEFYMDDIVRNMCRIVMGRYGCGKETFLSLTVPQVLHLHGDRLTPRCLRDFFKRLHEGSRSISYLKLTFSEDMFTGSAVVDYISSDILLPIWTISTHNRSLLKD